MDNKKNNIKDYKVLLHSISIRQNNRVKRKLGSSHSSIYNSPDGGLKSCGFFSSYKSMNFICSYLTRVYLSTGMKKINAQPTMGLRNMQVSINIGRSTISRPVYAKLLRRLPSRPAKASQTLITT